jgi:PBSX family phage terminase large subunit
MIDWAPKQLESYRKAVARLNIWDGAVSSGKTVASIWRWIDFILNGPPGGLLMCGKTTRTLKQNILNPMIELLPGAFDFTLSMGEARLGNRIIYLAGANDERSEGKIRGITLVGAYGDELTLWPDNFFRMLLSRLRAEGAKFFGTTNPDSPYHWLKQDYLDRKDDLDLYSCSFAIDDNPFLPAEYVKRIKSEYTGLWYKRFINGMWVQAEGAIYDLWDEKLHVTRDLPKFYRYIVGVDYGTANPCTFGLYGFNDSNRIVKVSEYFHDGRASGSQKTDSEYAVDFKSWIAPYQDRLKAVYIDPSAASFSLELQRAGMPVRECNNDVLDGIRFVAKLLSDRQYSVHESCRNTVKEFSSYVWDPTAQKRGEDKPLKTNDHTMDCDRYALYSHFGGYMPMEVATSVTPRDYNRMDRY